MEKFCTECGSPIEEGQEVCPNCGANAQSEGDTENTGDTANTENAENTDKADIGPIVSGVFSEAASAVSGEVGMSLTNGIGEILSPVQTALNGFKSIGTGVAGVFKGKNIKGVIVAGVIATVWIVLMILSYNGINIGFLNWLTFALGGTGRSVFGWIGGLLGKTAVASMVVTLICGGYRFLGGGFKSLIKGSNFKSDNIGPLLLGAGGAMTLYQFFAGSASWIDTMSAISGALLAVQSLGSGNGFIYRMALSLTAKVSDKTRTAQSEKANGLLSGVAYGFTLGGIVSFIPFGWLPIIIGGACVIAGIVLTIVFGKKKEVPAA